MSPFLSPKRTICSLLLLTQCSITLAQTCYSTDGNPASGFSPCNGTSSNSHCCAGGEACLTSGLVSPPTSSLVLSHPKPNNPLTPPPQCYMIYDQSINTGACTDQTWSTTKCFTQCPGSFQNPAPNTLFRCSDNEWCCSAGGSSGNTTSCCDDPNGTLFTNAEMNMPALIYNGSAWAPGFTLAPVAALAKQVNASNATAPAVTGDAGASCSTGTAAPSHNNSTKLGVDVGLGIGIPLLAALGGVLFLLAREKRANRRLQNYVNHTMGHEHPLHDFKSPVDGKQTFWAEMPGTAEVKEMPGNPLTTRTGEASYQELSSGTIRR